MGVESDGEFIKLTVVAGDHEQGVVTPTAWHAVCLLVENNHKNHNFMRHGSGSCSVCGFQLVHFDRQDGLKFWPRHWLATHIQILHETYFLISGISCILTMPLPNVGNFFHMLGIQKGRIMSTKITI